MGKYTDKMTDLTYELDPYADDYMDRLCQVSSSFRSFSAALDTFMKEHGYEGDLSDAESKLSYMKRRFAEEKIPVPRSLKRWYSDNVPIDKKTAYKICFAYKLDVAQTQDFMRRICLCRGFDCHDADELVYFWSISKGLDYKAAEDIRARITCTAWTGQNTLPAGGASESDVQNTKGNVLYTSDIIGEVMTMMKPDELISYINNHMEQFAGNNITAYSYIRRMWSEISCDEGIAEMERSIFCTAQGDGELYVRYGSLGDLDGNAGDFHKTARRESLWTIYLQILGFDEQDVRTLGTDRSIKPIFRDNPMICAHVGECFPNRDGLNKILTGVHVSDEQVRKTLILLSFYRHMAAQAVRKHDYLISGSDGMRCRAVMDSMLDECGYPALYEGNPYDWIFIFAMNTDYPIPCFRDYMRDMFCTHMEVANGHTDGA